MNNRQVKVGVIFSYLLIIINALYGLFLTPFIISRLGISEYGVYKTITSLTSTMMVLDLGIGGTVIRYIAKYRADTEEHKIPNFMAICIIQSLIICTLIAVVSIIVYYLINPLYEQTFTASELILAKKMFIVLTINIIIHVLENIFNGAITGYNHYIFANGVKLFRILIRIGLIYLLLNYKATSYTIVFIDLAITFASLFADILYSYFRLGVRIKYSYWDKVLFRESGIYTLLMFFASIAEQVNSNLDNVVIGAFSGPTFVSVYSIGLLIFGMYKNVSVSISGVMLPTVTSLLKQDKDGSKIKQLLIKTGRIQFLLLGAVVIGFFCIGKDFLYVWMGKGYEDAYIITLILIGPAICELCINVCLSILRAKNKLVFRTLILTTATIINSITTVILVKYWTYIGAAFGTAISYLLCSVIAMNVYYVKVIKLPILSIYREIIRGILPCLILAGVVLYISDTFIYGSWIAIITKVLVFCVIYSIALLTFGLNFSEKNRIPFIHNDKHI